MYKYLKNLGIEKINPLNGFHNQIYKGLYEGLEIIIRVSERRNLKEVKEEIDFLNRLKDKVNIAEPVEVKGQNPMALGEKTLSFYKFIQGQQWYERKLNQNHHFKAGQALGLIHQHTINKNFQRDSYTDHPDILLLADAPKMIKDELDKVLDSLSSWTQDKNQYGLIHGDYLFSNILYKDDEIFVIDFDDIEYNYYLYDIAVYLFYLLLGGDPSNIDLEPNIEVFKSFMKGYRSVNKQTILDMKKIQALFRLRQLKLFATISNLAQEKWGPWQKSFLELTKNQIIHKRPFVNIEYDKLYSQVVKDIN